MRTTAPRRRRDRGFSLLIVFMLVIVMVGIAAAVMLSTQQDLSVAGQDRESQQAFYAAEYAIAMGKDYLIKQLPPNAAANFNSTGGWTTILTALNQSGVAQGCATGPSLLPGTPISPRMGWSDYVQAGGTAKPFSIPVGSNRHVMWRFCIHNNSDDIAYVDTSGNNAATPSGCNGVTLPPSGNIADNCDWRDPTNLVTIEAWGAFPVDGTTNQPLAGASLVHLAANVGPPSSRSLLPLATDYAQEGAGGAHNNNGGSMDSTSINTSGPVVVK